MLQRLDRPAKHADGVHDLLLSLGDLSLAEIEARAAPRSRARRLRAGAAAPRRATGRIARGAIGGEAAATSCHARTLEGTQETRRDRATRGACSDEAFLEPVKDPPWADSRFRWARTSQGPFLPGALAARFGIEVEAAEEVLARLVERGKIAEGAFSPARQEEARFVRRRRPPGDPAQVAHEAAARGRARFGRRLRTLLCSSGRGSRGISTGAGQDALVETVGPAPGVPDRRRRRSTRAVLRSARVGGVSSAWLRPRTRSAPRGRSRGSGLELLGALDGRTGRALFPRRTLLSRLRSRRRATPRGRRAAAKDPRASSRSAARSSSRRSRARSGAFRGRRSRRSGAPRVGGRGDERHARAAAEPRQHRKRGERSASDLARIAPPPAASDRARRPRSAGRWSPPPRPPRGAGIRRRSAATALARALLERYGVLTREAACGGGGRGGFSVGVTTC